MGLRMYYGELVHRVVPKGWSYYWIGGDEPGGVLEEGTDLWVVAHNYASVTPIQLDLTDHAQIERISGWGLGVQSYVTRETGIPGNRRLSISSVVHPGLVRRVAQVSVGRPQCALESLGQSQVETVVGGSAVEPDRPVEGMEDAIAYALRAIA